MTVREALSAVLATIDEDSTRRLMEAIIETLEANRPETPPMADSVDYALRYG